MVNPIARKITIALLSVMTALFLIISFTVPYKVTVTEHKTHENKQQPAIRVKVGKDHFWYGRYTYEESRHGFHVNSHFQGSQGNASLLFLIIPVFGILASATNSVLALCLDFSNRDVYFRKTLTFLNLATFLATLVMILCLIETVNDDQRGGAVFVLLIALIFSLLTFIAHDLIFRAKKTEVLPFQTPIQASSPRNARPLAGQRPIQKPKSLTVNTDVLRPISQRTVIRPLPSAARITEPAKRDEIGKENEESDGNDFSTESSDPESEDEEAKEISTVMKSYKFPDNKAVESQVGHAVVKSHVVPDANEDKFEMIETKDNNDTVNNDEDEMVIILQSPVVPEDNEWSQ